MGQPCKCYRQLPNAWLKRLLCIFSYIRLDCRCPPHAGSEPPPVVRSAGWKPAMSRPGVKSARAVTPRLDGARSRGPEAAGAGRARPLPSTTAGAAADEPGMPKSERTQTPRNPRVTPCSSVARGRGRAVERQRRGEVRERPDRPAPSSPGFAGLRRPPGPLLRQPRLGGRKGAATSPPSWLRNRRLGSLPTALSPVSTRGSAGFVHSDRPAAASSPSWSPQPAPDRPAGPPPPSATVSEYG